MLSMTSGREWFAPQREKILGSKKRIALFLIAAYVAIRIKATLFSMVLMKLVSSREVGEPIEAVSWAWMRELFLDGQSFIALNLLTSLALCVFITAWLFQLSLRGALVRLGLRRPNSREVVLAVLATGSCLALELLTGWSLLGDDLSVEHDFLPITPGHYLVGPLGLLLPFGFLYRGLLVEASWSHLCSFVTLVVLIGLFQYERHLRIVGLEDFWRHAGWLLVTMGIVALGTAFEASYLRRASFRLGALVMLGLGSAITEISFQPETASLYYGPWAIVFAIAPSAFLLVLSMAWPTRSDEASTLATRKGSA